MTNIEYHKYFIQSRDRLPRLTRETMKKILDVYKDAGKQAAAAVRAAELSGLSDLTVDSWRAIEEQLSSGAQKIIMAIEDETYAIVRNSTEYTSRINQKYINDIIINIDSKITKTGIANLYRSVNETVISAIANRIYSDGYSFSTRIWRSGLAYQEQMRRVLLAGLAQGRDPVKLAEDLNVYIADGKIKLVNRYGNLVRGTGNLVKRISKRVDWRALRIVRSELYASLQESARLQGHANPAGLDMYDWILSRGRQDWNCVCPDFASGSPYEYQQVPGYPHAHCECRVSVRLRKHSDFIADLTKWSNNQAVPYLDNWYADNSYLLGAA